MTTITENTCRKGEVIYERLKMCFTGLALIAAAAGTAAYFNKYYPLPEIYKNCFEYLGYLCWITSLGGKGLNLLTWTQESPAELLDKNLTQIISLIGVFAFVFARELVIA